MIRRRRGAALLLALVAVVVLHGLAAVALWAAMSDLRTVTGVRLGVEGELAAASALAVARVHHAPALDALLPGERLAFLPMDIAAWRVNLEAERFDAVVALRASAAFRTAADSLLGARRLTLVMARDATDTLRVLRGRSRF